MNVNCLADGIQVQIALEDPDFDGVLYVKGYSKDEQCRTIIEAPRDTRLITENFKVYFGTCGLAHVNVNKFRIILTELTPINFRHNHNNKKKKKNTGYVKKLIISLLSFTKIIFDTTSSFVL